MFKKVCGLLIFIAVSAAAFAGEERAEIKFESLPESVRNAVSHSIDQKSISLIEKVSDGDHTRFDIKTRKTVANKNFVDTEMTVAPDGEIMKIIKEVPMFKIPYPIMRQVNHRYPNLKVDEVEIVMTRHFLLQGQANGRRVNLKIYDDGTVQELPGNHVDQRQTEKTLPNRISNEPTDTLRGPMSEQPYDDFEHRGNPLLDNQ